MSRSRADVLLVSRGLAPSRERAQALILAGVVRAAGSPVRKPGQLLGQETDLEVEAPPRFVSRGGGKLEAALKRFGIDVHGLTCADIGASTGGFTDCLLQRGARRVYAIDVGYGQLAERLRRDPRVVSMERTNARSMPPLPEPIDLATCDVSFIGLEKVLPAVSCSLAPDGLVIALVKPQFQGRPEEVGRGGVIRDPLVHARILGRLTAWLVRSGYRMLGLMRSPIEGAEGNREFLICLRPERRP